MAKIGRQGRLWLRTFHIFFMALWIGVAASETFILLFTGNVTDGSKLNVYFSIVPQLDSVLVPAAIGTVITGVLLAWQTAWGFFKHKWVIYKEVIFILAMLIAVIWLDPAVSNLAALAEAGGLNTPQNPEYVSAWNIGAILAIIWLLLLISAAFVSALKPWRKHTGAEEAA